MDDPNQLVEQLFGKYLSPDQRSQIVKLWNEKRASAEFFEILRLVARFICLLPLMAVLVMFLTLGPVATMQMLGRGFLIGTRLMGVVAALIDRVLQLVIKDGPVGNDDYAVKNLVARFVVQR